MELIYSPVVEEDRIDYGVETCAGDYGQECGYACSGSDN